MVDMMGLASGHSLISHKTVSYQCLLVFKKCQDINLAIQLTFADYKMLPHDVVCYTLV